MEQEINNWLKRGFRYAYHYRNGGTLASALISKQVTTNEASAKDKALSILYSDPTVKVWHLETELNKILASVDKND
jgi:hypothetical protein